MHVLGWRINCKCVGGTVLQFLLKQTEKEHKQEFIKKISCKNQDVGMGGWNYRQTKFTYKEWKYTVHVLLAGKV